MEFSLLIAEFVIGVQLLIVGLVIRYFAMYTPSWKNVMHCSLALVGFMAACFVGQYLIIHCLSSSYEVIVIDSSVHLRHALRELQFAIALVVVIVGPISFGFWTYQIRTAVTSATRERRWLVFGLMSSLLTCALVNWAVPNVILVFESFGPDLPLQTRFLLLYYKFSVILPLMVLVAWLTKGSNHGTLAALIGIVGSAMILVYSIWACNSPIVY